jgi:murein DD-endopeptidase MepM/ murein hydrolase activator NlpD
MSKLQPSRATPMKKTPLNPTFLVSISALLLTSTAQASSASYRLNDNADVSSTGCISPETMPPSSKPTHPSAHGEICHSGDFRWPVRGHIIHNFANGGDGINIAVPEGTQVKASEEGEVAFAGDELKGYGYLVLIRHPNGYVSAYAHNSELEVKRGDKVKRGQTIAKSGQSGAVGSPQLHFELRHGSMPVDPMSCFPSDG